jgi:pentatricopeptide repeat protein
MEKTFKDLCEDSHANVSGVHWASLINAYGCVGKNLDKALEVFDSIAMHPSIKSGSILPDAVTYEALVNVLVTHRRLDLVTRYLQQMRERGVHMTAYIFNLLIRAHALAGDIETARGVFESMVDPPAGVAAPNNHAPHDASQSISGVHPDAPVYREVCASVLTLSHSFILH